VRRNVVARLADEIDAHAKISTRPGHADLERIARELRTSEVIDPNQLRPGDVVDLPAEPPVGTELVVRGGGHEGLTLHRVEAGWLVAGTDDLIRTWIEVFRIWGPASQPGVVFEVVRAPRRCAWPLCGRWLPVDAAPQRKYCSGTCQKAASRDRLADSR
jgi:hypothetical protein